MFHFDFFLFFSIMNFLFIYISRYKRVEHDFSLYAQYTSYLVRLYGQDRLKNYSVVSDNQRFVPQLIEAWFISLACDDIISLFKLARPRPIYLSSNHSLVQDHEKVDVKKCCFWHR